MPTFGQHETAQRLFLSGVGGLYALKADDKKVIKVLQPPAGIWSDDTVREEIDGFLLRAKTQRHLSRSSQNWAPVHETGAIREGTEGSSGGGQIMGQSTAAAGGGAGGGEYRASGAYAIMDRYERSAQSLIDGRVKLTNADLRNIISGAIRGLMDVGKIASRPHGNLKPTNILLTNSADLSTATVHLADPAPDGALNKDSASRDLADLGRILFLLVNLRAYDGGTINRSKEWDKLGPNGEDWRKLCNALIDPHAPAEERDLERILPKIQTWTAKPRTNKMPILAAASIFLVLVIGGGAWWYLALPQKLDFNQAKWEKLCLSYYSWFQDFSDQMSDDNTKNKFANAPYPSQVVKFFNDAGKDLDKYSPKKIAKRPSSPNELAADPTDDAKTGYGPYYTSKGDDLIDAVSAALTPQQWPLLGQLDKTAKTYQDRGWEKPAAGIHFLIDSAKPPDLPTKPIDINQRIKDVKHADIYMNIERTIKAARTVTEIDAGWTHIQDALKKLPQGDAQNVPLIKALPKFAEDFPRSKADPDKPGSLDDVTSLAAAFKQIEETINKLDADLTRPGQEIVYSELAKDPAVQVPENAALTPASFANLPAIAHGYVKITDDPRSTTDWKKSLADVQASFIAVINEANPQDKNLPALIKERNDLQKAVADWAGIAPIEKNRDQLKTLVAAASTRLDTLKKNGNEWVTPYIVDPAAYIAQQRARLDSSPLSKGSPAVFAAWKKAHSDLIAKAQAEGAALKKWATYKEFDGRFTNLEKAFAEFNALIPANVPDLSAIAGNDWRHTIAAYVAGTYRENALADIVGKFNFSWGQDQALVPDAAFVSYRTQRLSQFEQTRKDTLALIDDYFAISARLDHLDLLPNEPAQGVKSWRDLYTTWQNSHNPLLIDATIAAALKPIGDRAAALLALDSVNEYKPLVTEASSSSAAEIILTAWRKLAAAPVSEDLPVLDDEDKIETALTQKFTSLNSAKTLDDAHFKKLTAEVSARRPAVWHRWADTLSSATAIQSALDRAASFNVTLSPQTDAAMLYNQQLYALRKEFEKNLPEAQLKPIAQKFIDAAGALPAGSNPEIKDLLARMTKSLTQSQDDSSSAGAGPKLAGWEQDNSRDGFRIFYFPNKANAKYTLEFVRLVVNEASVAPSAAGAAPGGGGGQKTIFLCTTEMPVGLFIETVNAAKLSDLDNTGKPANQQHWFKFPATKADDIWADQGPRAWKIDGKKFALNDTWLSETAAQMLNKPYYPDGGKPPEPAANDPMQLISPWSAMYAARLLGCRLPTSDEWKAAYDKFEAASTDKDVWNLRGEGAPGKPSWRTEQDYARLMSANGMQFPDKGVFLPVELMFADIAADKAKPWSADALAKIAPGRFTAGSATYKGSTLWFRPVYYAPPNTSEVMHDLVGNVAEYLFDGPSALNVVKNNVPTAAEIDAAVATPYLGANGKKQPTLFVIGGSSLSPPDIPFNAKQVLDPSLPQTATGFCDVGFRLAYTAPIDSIVDVLAATFKDPRYLPGPKAGRSG